jgi:outer membrane receptor protein involved in Fe transport
MEYEGLIVNAGLRLDYFTPGKQVNTDSYKKAWKEATQLIDKNGNIEELNVDELQLYLSPRFGISHPITDKAALFFNYGHFYQLPERQYIFRDPYLAKGWIGNPNLKSPKTVCYEFGFSQELLFETLITVKGFYKDYFNYIGSMEVGPAARRVFMFYNRDYANAKGFELSLSKPYSDNFSFEANYTYSSTKGRSESPFEESYSVWSGSALLPSETRMPWDQNHTLNCLFTYYVSENNKILFLNSPVLRNLGVTFKYNYGSGFPYTPTGKNLKYSKNSFDMPYTSQFDMRIEKKVFIVGNLSLNFYIDCINLLNRKNVKEINPLTGKPYTYGDLYDNTNNRILTYKEILSKLDESKFYGMRQILTGVKIEF